MKNFKRILALVLTVITVVACVVVPANAADEKATYSTTAIERLNKLGIFKGSTSGDMHADDQVTREQMALFTGRVLTGKVDKNYWETYENDTTFEDIDTESDEYIGAIAYAYENDIVVGKSDVRFDPKGNVLYRDALTMVVRSLGYTGLSYPNGYINKAIKLGLTDDIDGVAYDEPAVRGVVATILYNALYADNSSIAQKFDLTSGVYMLVSAGQFRTAAGTDLPVASIAGYKGRLLSSEHVAFAALKSDLTVDNSKYIYAKKTQIDEDVKVNYANRLGYMYQITFEGDEIAWVTELESKTFQNYGDTRTIGKTVIGNYDVTKAAYLTLGSQAYNLVDHWNDDNSTPVNTEDLILYTAAKADLYTYDYQYDVNGNILNETGIELYNGRNIGRTAGKYYKQISANVFVEATAEELFDARYKVSYTTTTSAYDILLNNGSVGTNNGSGTGLGTPDTVKTLSDNYFCQIVAFDANGDGEYDVAVYTPYYIGYAGNVDKTNNRFSITGGKSVSGKITDWAGSENLSSWAWYLYTVNENTQEIAIVEKLTALNNQKVTWASKGAPSDGIYKDSSVKIGDATYKVGGWNANNLYGIDVVCGDGASNLGFDGVPNKTFNNSFGLATTGYFARYNNGWNDLLTIAMDSRYSGFKGFVLAGHVVFGYPTLKAAASNYAFVAFDPFVSTFAVENDNIVVKALTDTTGVYSDVKIKSIDGEIFTQLEYNAFCNYIDLLYTGSTVSGNNENLLIKYSYFFNDAMKAKFEATAGFKAELRKLIFTQLCTLNSLHTTGAMIQANTHVNETAACASGHVDTFLYSLSKKNDDGTVELSVVDPVDMYGRAVDNVVTFKFGVSSAKISTVKNGEVALNTVLATTDKTVFTFVAADGIYTYVGKPADGDSLVLTSTTSIYAANASAVMIIDMSRPVDEIAKGTYSWTGSAKCSENHTFERSHIDTWAFAEADSSVIGAFRFDHTYLITANTKNKEIFTDDKGNIMYSYTGLYDLEAQKEVDAIFVGKDAEVFNAAIVKTGSEDAAANLGMIICKNDDEAPVAYTIDDYMAAMAGDVFNLSGSANSFAQGVFTSVDKDNNSEWAHVSIDGVPYTVRGVKFIIVNCERSATTGKIVKCTVSDNFASLVNGSTAFYNYNAKTGELTGYAFSVVVK